MGRRSAFLTLLDQVCFDGRVATSKKVLLKNTLFETHTFEKYILEKHTFENKPLKNTFQLGKVWFDRGVATSKKTLSPHFVWRQKTATEKHFLMHFLQKYKIHRRLNGQFLLTKGYFANKLHYSWTNFFPNFEYFPQISIDQIFNWVILPLSKLTCSYIRSNIDKNS